MPLPVGHIAPELSGSSHVQTLQALPVQAEIDPTLIPSRNIRGALRYPFAIFCSAASLRMQLIQSAGAVEAAISVRGALGALQARPAGATLAAGTVIKAAADAGAASCGAMDFAQSMALAAAPRSAPAEKSEAIHRQEIDAAVAGAVLVNSAATAKMGVQISAVCTAAAEMPTEKTRAAMFVDGTLETLEPEDFGSLTALPAYALTANGLKKVFLPDTVKTISENVIYWNEAIVYVRCSPHVSEIPSTWWPIAATKLGESTLDCTSYTNVPTLKTTESTDKGTISFDVVKVPNNLLSQWKAALKWSDIVDKIVAG